MVGYGPTGMSTYARHRAFRRQRLADEVRAVRSPGLSAVDAGIIAIVIIGSLVFFGVLIWKGIWFLRKINEAPEDEE